MTMRKHIGPHGSGTCRNFLAALGMIILAIQLWTTPDLRSLNLQLQGLQSTSSVKLKAAGSDRSILRVGDRFLPVVPPPVDSEDEARKSLQIFFQHYVNTTVGGFIDVSNLNKSDIGDLRGIGQSIMKRKITCGSPKSQSTSVAESDGLEHCFWNGDFVSNKALSNFKFERNEWTWVVNFFQDVFKDYPSDASCLAFLDAGVNVGDWASPIRLDMPEVTYLGIEGQPATAAIATANMLTSVEYHRQLGKDVAPSILLPLPLLPWKSLEQARTDGGVCFDVKEVGNIGGGAINTTGSWCKTQSTAGATFLPHVLNNFAMHFQQECGGDWPSIFLAKWDIQDSEFAALSSAMDWLQQRPPCFMMLEFTNLHPQNYAIMHLLTDLGYDAVWRNVDNLEKTYERPPEKPHWTAESGTSIFEMYDKDMAGKQWWFYMNYMFGFQDQNACIQRLLGAK